MLYNLINTFPIAIGIEGNKRHSQSDSYRMAKYGRSKEKRSDAKLVVLAMVINIEGFFKYSAIHEGNYADKSDFKILIEKHWNG